MVKKLLLESISHVEDYWNNLCYVGKEKIFCFLSGTKGLEIWNLAEGIKKKVEIRGRALMFNRGEGPKSDKGSLHMMNMKKKMNLFTWGGWYWKQNNVTKIIVWLEWWNGEMYKWWNGEM